MAPDAEGAADRPGTWRLTTVVDLDRFVPAVIVAIVLGLPGGITWARVARVPLPLGVATAASLGVVLAATLSPAGWIPESGTGIGTCDLQHWWPGTIDLFVPSEETLNLALLAPLGFCLGLHRTSRARNLAILFAIGLPILVELGQLSFPALGRYCDSLDVVDNEIGLVATLGPTLVLAALLRRAFASDPAATATDSTPSDRLAR